MTIEEALDYVNDINKTVTWTEEQKVDEAFFNNVAEMLEELKELKEQSRWIPVTKRLPEDFENYKGKNVIDVLVTTENGRVTKVQRRYEMWIGWYFTRIYSGVKAWMPLPEPFKEGEQND